MRMIIVILVCWSLITLNRAWADSGVLDIEWPTATKSRGSVAARKAPYPDVLQNGVRNVRLPVLLPASLAYDKKMSIVSDQFFYTVTFVQPGATVMITGDRLYQQTIPSGSDLEAQLKSTAGVMFSHDEGMMTADFNRYGVNYTLQVECAKPATDIRCTQENFIRKLYGELDVVGGRP